MDIDVDLSDSDYDLIDLFAEVIDAVDSETVSNDDVFDLDLLFDEQSSSTDRRRCCRKCGNEGHNKRTCPQNHSASVRRCSNCRQTGHDRRNCVEPSSYVATASRSKRLVVVLDDLLGPADSTICEGCRRSSTNMHYLDIRLEKELHRYVWKTFGNNGNIGKKPCFMCYDCRRYYAKKVTGQYRNAWPAHIWSFLSGRKKMDGVKEFIKILPVEIRQTYFKSLDRMPVSVRDMFLHTKPVSIDLTARLDLFKENMTPSKMYSPIWGNLLNEYPFPDVVCPMGCLVFFDRGNMRLPMIHYLNLLDPLREEFHGSRSWLIGKRPTWPESVNIGQLFKASVGVAVDKDIGLCFFACSADIHRMKGTAFIHMPRLPFMPLAPNRADNLGLAVCAGNFVKSSKHSEFNYSSRVVKLAGNQIGMSTTTIHARPISNRQMDEDEEVHAAIVLKNRPDVKRHLEIVSGRTEIGRFESLYNEMVEDSPLFEATINECVHGATRLHSEYAMELMDMHLRQKVLQIPEGMVTADLTRLAIESQEKTALQKIMKFIRFPLFNGDGGHVPFVCWSSWFKRVKKADNRQKLLEILVEILCNNVPLYRSFLEHFTRRQEPDFVAMLKVVTTIVLRTYTGSQPVSVPDKWRKAVEDFETFIECVSTNDGADDEDGDRIGVFLKQYGKGVLFYKRGHYNADDVYDITNFEQFNTVVISRSVDASLHPQHVNHDELIRLLKECHYVLMGVIFLKMGSEFRFIMRWKPELKWQTSHDSSGHRSRLINDEDELNRLINEGNILIYQRKPAHVKRIEVDIQLMSGCQNVAGCALHRFALIREPKGSSILCCLKSKPTDGQCLSGLAYRCPDGINNGIQCEIGICHRHFREIKVGGEVRKIDRGLFVDPVKQLTDPAAIRTRELLRLKKEVAARRSKNVSIDMLASGRKDEGKTLDIYGNRATAGHYALNTFCKMRPTRLGRLQTPVAAQCVLQNIISTSSDNRVPLLYPEAALFPQMTWKASRDTADGVYSYDGALCYTFYGGEQESRAVHSYFGSFTDHMAVRIRDASLPSAQMSDCRCLLFDAMANEKSRAFPIHMFLSKGPEVLLETRYKDGVDVNLTDGHFGVDNNAIGVKRGVNQLANDIRTYGKWDYFLTITCNDKGTPGVKKLTERILSVYGRNEELVTRAFTCFLPVQLRMWDRFKTYFLDWLRHSPDEPLGPKVEVFARDEFQSKGSLGNKNHVHIGVRCNGNETVEEQLHRIRNNTRMMFGKDTGLDFENAIKHGFVKSHEEWVEVVAEYERFNHHFCSDPNARCHVDKSETKANIDAKKPKMKDEKKECKARNHEDSLEYGFRSRSDIYSEDVLAYLEYVGLADRIDGKIVPKQCMIGGSYTYPSTKSDGMQPTVPAIYLACRSSTNVLKTDFKFVISYLLKYEYGIEEWVVVKLSETKGGEIRAETGEIENIKRGSRKRLKVTENMNANTREICEAEAVKVLLKSAYIEKDIECVHVATTFAEDRSAVCKFSQKEKTEPGGLHLPPSISYHECFDDAEDKFTAEQEVMILDWFTGDWAIDNTLWFSLRPPLLRAVDSLETFAGSFIRGKLNKVKKPEVRLSLVDGPMIDGSNHIVKIRIAMLMKLIRWVRKNCNARAHRHSHSGHTLDSLLLKPLEEEYLLNHGNALADYSEFFRRFVDIKATKKVAVVFSSISPKCPSKFLYHLLLIYGRFVTELDLMQESPVFQKWFTVANIMPPLDQVSEEDVQELCRKYVGDFLIYQPIGHKQMCTDLKFTVDVLRSFFLDRTLVYDGPAIVLNRSMREVFAVEVQAEMDLHKLNLLTALIGECSAVDNIPSVSEFMSDQRLVWNVEIPQKASQSSESLIEQKKAWSILRNSIDEYKGTTKTFVKGVCISGPPGAGKSFLLSLACLYGLASGLNCMIVAMTAARAQLLGGLNIHRMTGLQDRNPGNISVKTMVQNTLLYLEKHPLVKERMKTLDILFIDESGLVNAQIFSALSSIFGILKDSPNVPFGGLLVQMTGDPRQLPPITGKPIWISPRMIVEFKQIVLREYVRAEDPDLQQALRLFYDNSVMSSTVADQITELVVDKIPDCNFHSSWDTLPAGCQLILSKRQGVRSTIAEMNRATEQKIKDWNFANPVQKRKMFYSTASDRVAQSNLHWEKGGSRVTRFLNDVVIEEETVFIAEQAVMRFTYNGKTPGGIPFAQGQLCIVKEIDFAVDPVHPRLTVQIAPIGVNEIDPENVPSAWVTMYVNPRETDEVYMDIVKARVKRYQYPLVFASACTIHKAIGRTCHSVAIKFSVCSREDGIWDPRMLYVLISRVKQLRDIHFVGSREQIRRAFHTVLLKTAKWASYIATTLAKLNILHQAIRTRVEISVRNYSAPSPVGFVYGIISTKVPSLMYIGETGDFARRLVQHNSASGGSVMTNNAIYQPWVPCILISGFSSNGPDCPENIRLRKRLEQLWHRKVNGGPSQLCDSFDCVEKGSVVFDEFKASLPLRVANDLKWINYVSREYIRL